MIDGITIVIGGVEYIFPDLNLKAVQKVYPFFAILSNPSHPDFITAIIKVVTAGLQRNYPNITEDFVAENCMLHEIAAIGEAIDEQAAKKKKMETSAPVMNLSIGVSSTPE